MLISNNNLKKHSLTKQLKQSKRIGVKELKNYPGFENTSDEEADSIIQSLYTIAQVLLTIKVNNNE